MASASSSCTVYIDLRRAKHWAKNRSSGTLSKPNDVRNSSILSRTDETSGCVLRSAELSMDLDQRVRPSCLRARWGESLCRSADESGPYSRTAALASAQKQE